MVDFIFFLLLCRYLVFLFYSPPLNHAYYCFNGCLLSSLYFFYCFLCFAYYCQFVLDFIMFLLVSHFCFFKKQVLDNVYDGSVVPVNWTELLYYIYKIVFDWEANISKRQWWCHLRVGKVMGFQEQGEAKVEDLLWKHGRFKLAVNNVHLTHFASFKLL